MKPYQRRKKDGQFGPEGPSSTKALGGECMTLSEARQREEMKGRGGVQ